MSKVFQAAMANGLITSNPVRSVKAPRGGHKPKVVPTRDQVVAMIDAAHRRASAGLRGGARLHGLPDLRGDGHLMVGLERLADRDPQRQGRQVSSSADDADPCRDPAGVAQATGRRASARDLVGHRARLRAFQRLRHVLGPHNARKRFKPITDGVASDDPTKARPAICPGATPHSLRHATATLLLEEGVPMKVVSELLGHSSTRVTEDTYSHVIARLVAEAGAAIERALG